MSPGADILGIFPPAVVIEVKALACELPHKIGIPLSRLSIQELKREVIGRGIVAKVSGMTLWRWLTQDAIKPWRYRSWIFPRDVNFSYKAGRVLDLYGGFWEGRPLSSRDYVISADEKTSIQARKRKHHPLAPQPGRVMRIEHEYIRKGAWTYLAAWDIKRAKIFGRLEEKNGIDPFDRLVGQVMSQQPYASAQRVFWIMDNCSCHRGEKSVKRLCKRWPNIVPVHLPIHASWLNQIEIYFSIVTRKVLTPNDFSSLAELEDRIFNFQDRYQEVAKPFEWKFTRIDLERLCEKLTFNERIIERELVEACC
jgi:transposase